MTTHPTTELGEISSPPAEPGSAPIRPAFLEDALPLAPACALAIFWVLSCLFSGAYFESAWYPAAIVIVAVCPLLLAAGWRLPIGGARVAFALLAAFVAWTALSILWADAGGHALEATNKLILALATAFVFATTPWNERRATWMLGLLVGGITLASTVTLLSAALAEDPSGAFIEGRYADPLGYAGASAAFAAIAVWPALALSARGGSAIWQRAVWFAVAVVQVELALLPQARGVLIGFAASAVLFVAYSSSRGWAAVRVLVAAVVVGLSTGPVLDVYSTVTDGGSVPAALDDAVRGLVLAACIALVAGTLVAFLEARRPRLAPAGLTAKGARRAFGAAAILVVVGVAILGVLASGEVRDRWDEFRSGSDVSTDSASRFTSTADPQRYDYWRVAIEVAEDAPVAGIGAGNFQDAYAVDREDEKHSRYAHNVWLRILSETGLVGLALLVGSLLTACIAVARRRSRLPATTQLLIAGSVSASALVFAHSSIDWIEEFPAVLGPALALLFLACRLAMPPPKGRPTRQAAGLVVVIAIAGIALAALVPAYLSLRFTERAERAWIADPKAAYDDLDRAAYLNPLSSQPDLTLARIATARNEDGRARAALERAIDTEDSWYPHFELALIASERGARQEAIRQMRSAQRLNVADPLVEQSLAELRSGTRLTPEAVHAQIQAEAEERFAHLR